MKTRSWILVLVASLAGWAHAAHPPADAIVGVWATEDAKAHVEIYQRDGRYYGKFVWFKNDPKDGGPDEKNPDPDLRDRSLLGTDFILGFRFRDNKWRDGRIYNPEDGKSYKADLELGDGVLKVRGWIGVRLLGRTVEWARVR